MRFVWAVVAFVLAAVLIGAGIAQRTIFEGPSTQLTRVEVEEPAPFLLMDGDVLRSNPGAQTLQIRGDGEIFAAYGRTADMKAWLADSDYNEVSVGKGGALDVEHVTAPEADADEPEAPATEEPATEEPATEEPATEEPATEEPATEEPATRNPIGSDLWLDSFSKSDTLIADNLQLPEGVSVLISYDGSQSAPDDVVVSWPLDNSTPWAGPLLAAGGVVLLIGLVLYVLGIRHQRRGRGPRRKGPGPLPVTEPIDLAALPASERAAIGASTTGGSKNPAPEAASAPDKIEDGEIVDESKDEGTQRSVSSARPRRRRLLALPALGVTVLLAAGCSAESWPQLDEPTATPSPTPTVIAPENQKPPAVTEAQATRILGDISATLVEADTNMDIELAATRLDGPALAVRTTEYALRTALPETVPPAAIPTDKVEVVLPEATDRWPRTVLLLSKSTSDDTLPPVILTATQQDPWSTYKVSNIAEMSADVALPDVAASWLGTSLVPADSAFLTVPPADLAAAFADVVDTGETSASYGLFDEQALSLATSIRDSRQTVAQGLIDKGASETSATSFDIAPTDASPVSLTTLDSGAIVSVSLIDSETVTPKSADVSIRWGENPQAKALTGVTESAKGIVTKYEFQLFFSVPAQGSTEQIRLLAVRQDLLSVEVIK